MDVAQIVALAGQFGPLGLLVAYLVWKERQDRAATERLDEKKAAERALEAERRMAFDHSRLETDRATAAALAGLTAVIQGLRR